VMRMSGGFSRLEYRVLHMSGMERKNGYVIG
jgi:hypothetical protein